MNTELIFTESPTARKWIKIDNVIYTTFRVEQQTIVVAILTGGAFNSDNNKASWTTFNIYAEAASRGLIVPDSDTNLANLFLDCFTKSEIKEMLFGFIVIMHELDGCLGELPKISTHRSGDKLHLCSVVVRPSGLWDLSCGNVFLAPEELFPQLRKRGIQIP